MKNDKDRISRRVLRHFLNLAAASFALGNVGPASANDDDTPPPAHQMEGETRAEARGENNRRGNYLHTFGLPQAHAVLATHTPRARVRVLDANGRLLTQQALDGAATLGPFADGAYAVLIKANGLTELHRVRIGPDTQAYLRFSEPA